MPVELVAVTGAPASPPRRLPTEQDGSLALKTLQDNFPGCCGLTFVNPETESTRGLRLKDGYLYPPSEGWGRYNYVCSFPKVNHAENSINRTMQKDATDLIVLGLPWKTTEQTVREYFETFGKVKKVWLKRDAKGQSKGFAFVRFASYHTQMRVLTKKHTVDGRRCDVLIPHSKRNSSSKVFVGGCTEDMTADDLREYFSKRGEVTDVFVPKPFRPFGFVTFLDPETAQSVCDENHVIGGVAVSVSIASPKHQNRSHNHDNHHFVNDHKESSYGERKHHFDPFQNDHSLNVDMLNFQGLTLGSQDYIDRSQNTAVSYNKFATVDRTVTPVLNQNIWGNFSNLTTGSDSGCFGINNQQSGSYNNNNYFPWLHPGNFQGPSGQWNQMQVSSNPHLS